MYQYPDDRKVQGKIKAKEWDRVNPFFYTFQNNNLFDLTTLRQ